MGEEELVRTCAQCGSSGKVPMCFRDLPVGKPGTTGTVSFCGKDCREAYVGSRRGQEGPRW